MNDRGMHGVDGQAERAGIGIEWIAREQPVADVPRPTDQSCGRDEPGKQPAGLWPGCQREKTAHAKRRAVVTGQAGEAGEKTGSDRRTAAARPFCLESVGDLSGDRDRRPARLLPDGDGIDEERRHEEAPDGDEAPLTTPEFPRRLPDECSGDHKLGQHEGRGQTRHRATQAGVEPPVGARDEGRDAVCIRIDREIGRGTWRIEGERLVREQQPGEVFPAPAGVEAGQWKHRQPGGDGHHGGHHAYRGRGPHHRG